MKRYKYYFVLYFVSLFGISCKKNFLNVPNTTLLRQTYVTDLKTTSEYLNGIYIKLGEEFFQGYNHVYGEIVADNLKPVAATPQRPLTPHYNWSQMADNTIEPYPQSSTMNMNGLWLTGYQIVRSCSFVIEKVDNFRNENPSKADDIKAQAYAIRALVHSVLVNVFSQSYNFTADASHSGIPYVTTSDWTKSVSRQTVGEVYNNIISDLNNAIPLFNMASSNVLLMNRNASRALLARTYLFKGEYATAKNLAREVGSLIPIMTGTDYPSKLFTAQEKEALFQLTPSYYNVNNGSYATSFMSRYFTSTLRYLATSDIASLLTKDTADVRKGWVTLNSGTWRVTKYPSNLIPGFDPPSTSYYQTLLRSSEMYLTAAEAYARLSNEDSARYYLDEIRKRANPSVTKSTESGSALLNLIYDERRKELSFEGLRLFDLMRWKKNISRVDALDPSVQNLAYPSTKVIAPLPKPDVNSGLPQNTDY